VALRYQIGEERYNYEVGFPIAGIAGLAVPVLTPKGRSLSALVLGATEARLAAERRHAVLPNMLEEANRIRSAAGASRAVLDGR
jgi:DNA-binding IclR family transcriptional regulator